MSTHTSFGEKATLDIVWVYRFAVAAGVVCFGFAFVSWAGTQRWGYSTSGMLQDLAISAIFLIPASIVPFIGCRLRVAIIGVAITFIAAFVPGEVFARAQEYLVIREHGIAPAQDVVIDRWEPQSQHTIAYFKDRGWTGWD
jgi:hypothetical protein